MNYMHTHDIHTIMNMPWYNVLQTLRYKVKTQYVQISNIIDTSIKHPISGQSTPMVKGCMDMHMIWQVLSLVIKGHWSSAANFFRNLPRKKKVVIWNAQTAFLLCGAELVNMKMQEFTTTWHKMKDQEIIRQNVCITITLRRTGSQNIGLATWILIVAGWTGSFEILAKTLPLNYLKRTNCLPWFQFCNQLLWI